MSEAAPLDLERFRSMVSHVVGLHVEDSKLSSLDDLLRRRLAATRLPFETYLSRLRERDADEIAALARELTVAETYFFRHVEQLRAFAEAVLPECLAAGRGRVRVLSAGCASGEEAYSLAMVTQAALPGHDDVSIVGVDLNPAIVEKARRGRFSPWALRGMPEDMKHRWLRADGREFVLDEGLRQSVRFTVGNLVSDDPLIWAPETYDVIFCRNVLLYFDREQTQAAVARLARALVPGGYLFLGHAETLRGISADFDLRHTHGAFYYRRKSQLTRTSDVDRHARAEAVDSPLLAEATNTATSWVEAIRVAAERIATLTTPTPQGGAARTPSSPGTPAWDLGLALDLVRKERFAEALAIVEALPPESGQDADVLLLHAALLTHGAAFARAEDACRRLLDVDGLNAGAHYLLALCREATGDAAGATHHDQVAAYLDPSFAMPRLHLGLLARRAGDRTAARRELGQALLLLQREDAARVLLFGGGFGREALEALCRTEMQRSGETA
jgi:chemotaxis protein methyltransferase CheR